MECLNTGYLILLRDYYFLDVTVVLWVLIPFQREQCDEILVDEMLGNLLLRVGQD